MITDWEVLILASIFSLYGSIFIDNEKANKAIDDTGKNGESFAS